MSDLKDRHESESENTIVIRSSYYGVGPGMDGMLRIEVGWEGNKVEIKNFDDGELIDDEIFHFESEATWRSAVLALCEYFKICVFDFSILSEVKVVAENINCKNVVTGVMNTYQQDVGVFWGNFACKLSEDRLSQLLDTPDISSGIGEAEFELVSYEMEVEELIDLIDSSSQEDRLSFSSIGLVVNRWVEEELFSDGEENSTDVLKDKYVFQDGKRVFERIPGTKYFTLNGLGKFIIPKGCTHLFHRVSALTPAEERAFYNSNDNIVSTNVHRALYKPQSDKNEQ